VYATLAQAFQTMARQIQVKSEAEVRHSPHYRPANRSAIAAWISVGGGSKSWLDAHACMRGTIPHAEEENASWAPDMQREKCSCTYLTKIPYPRLLCGERAKLRTPDRQV
jgi:hypothetical protein